MDRYLLSGALVALVIQVGILLADLGLLPVELNFLSSHSISNQKEIGVVSFTKQNVRRRGRDSIMWEDSASADRLYSYDSILTLSKSSAQLELYNNIDVQLHENTLVVLEPITNNKTAKFRLRFSRGNLRTFSPDEGVKLGSQEWNLEAQAGSDLNLRSLNDDKIEVEILKGKVHFNHSKNNKAQTLEEGHRLTLEKDKISEVNTFTKSTHWKTKNDQRIYTHGIPVEFHLKWKGPAQSIEITHPDRFMENSPLPVSTQSQKVLLNYGTYYFRLKESSNSTPTLAVHVWPAPKIRYFAPLPRDRVKTSKEIIYSWGNLDSASSYRLEFSQNPLFEEKLLQDSKNNLTHYSINEEGSYFWRVIGIDEQGYEIPPYYNNQIYSVPNPLAPPKLHQPLWQRNPSSPKKKNKKSSFLDKIYNLIIPPVYAKESDPFIKRKIIFSWYPVPDADHYIIEVSSNPNFRSPEVIELVREEKFEWTKFEKKIFYWRVAAGQKDRKGLFSEPAKVDLTKLSDLKLGELSPGVQYEVTSAIQKPVPKKVVKATPIPEQLKAEPEPAPKPPVKDAPLNDSQKDFKGNTWLSGSYHSTSVENTSSLKANLNGFALIHFGGLMNFPLEKLGSVILSWQFYEFNWKPKKPENFPLQKDLENWEIVGNILYKAPTGKFCYGLAIDTVSVFERESLEQIKVHSKNTFGVGGNYTNFFLENWSHRHEMTYTMGSGFNSAWLSNHINYHFPTGEPIDVIFGGSLDGKYVTGEKSFKTFHYSTGFYIGVEW